MKKILVTGFNGFLGRNLLNAIKHINNVEVYVYGRNNTEEELIKGVTEADYIFHFAGEVVSSCSDKDMYDSNVELTKVIINTIKKQRKVKKLFFASSIHAKDRKNTYGISKSEAEDLIKTELKGTIHEYIIYRLPHMFGKYAKANHNSVIATWLHNKHIGKENFIYDTEIDMTYCYIDDFIIDTVSYLNRKYWLSGLYSPTLIYKVKLGYVYELINSFDNDVHINFGDFEKKLYKTYLSYKTV